MNPAERAGEFCDGDGEVDLRLAGRARRSGARAAKVMADAAVGSAHTSSASSPLGSRPASASLRLSVASGVFAQAVREIGEHWPRARVSAASFSSMQAVELADDVAQLDWLVPGNALKPAGANVAQRRFQPAERTQADA